MYGSVRLRRPPVGSDAPDPPERWTGGVGRLVRSGVVVTAVRYRTAPTLVEGDDVLSLEIGNWEIARDVSEWIEVVAITVIVLAILVAFWTAARIRLRGSTTDAITAFKRQIARGLLIGLDLLIAADVIRTVTLEPTLENVAALGLLVVVRTFLAWTLVLEAENRWPWQRDSDEATASMP